MANTSNRLPFKNAFNAKCFVCALLALAVGLIACGAPKATGPRLYEMGARAEVGSLVYSVLEAEWDPNFIQTRLPKHRFVVLRVSVTNSGPTEVMVPAMQLVASDGQAYPELTDGAGVADWIGPLHRLAAAETVHGRVLFDAPRSNYKLRVSDDALDPQETVAALIEIPLRFESRDRLTSPATEHP